MTDEYWQLLEATELMKQGVMPVSGGWLDQTQSFLDATAAVRSDMAWWKLAKNG